MVYITGAVADLSMHSVVRRSGFAMPPDDHRRRRNLDASKLEDPIRDGVLIEPSTRAGIHRETSGERRELGPGPRLCRRSQPDRRVPTS